MTKAERDVARRAFTTAIREMNHLAAAWPFLKNEAPRLMKILNDIRAEATEAMGMLE